MRGRGALIAAAAALTLVLGGWAAWRLSRGRAPAAPGGSVDSHIVLPAKLTPNELRLLSLLLPDGVELELEAPETLLLVLRAPGSGRKLVTWDIRRGTKPDFSGPSLPALVMDLSGTAAARYRAALGEPLSAAQTAAKVVDDTTAAVSGRHCQDGAWRLSVRAVHAREPGDWK